MRLFGGKKGKEPALDRETALSARPVLTRLVKLDTDEEGNAVLQVPRPDTSTMRVLSRLFGMPPYKRVALDELGTFVIELCDGGHSVREISEEFAERFRLNRREAEVSTTAFVRTLARRSIIALVIDESNEPA
jgi:hypothetical protein